MRNTRLADPKDQEQLINLIKGKDGWDVPPERVADIAFVRKSGTDYESRRHNLLHSIIDGPLDTDKIHYLQFDSIHTGNPVGSNFDSEQLIDSLSFTETFDGLAVSDKGLAAVESFLYSRYRMHIDVYWHHTVRGVRKMIARAIDWHIRVPRAGTGVRQARVMKAATGLTDRNFLEWLAAEFLDGEPASQIIGHLIRVERRKGSDFVTDVHPVRKLFKRFRTYTSVERGDPESKEIFDLLKPGGGATIGVRDYERHVAKTLSDLVSDKIALWELIIDIPPSMKEEPAISVYCTKAQPPAQSHQPLTLASAVAREIVEDFGRNLKKIRFYCSPRVRELLRRHEGELNANIKCAINDAIKEATRKVQKKGAGRRAKK